MNQQPLAFGEGFFRKLLGDLGMRIAITGAGNVGGTLGTAWAQKAGHEIFFRNIQCDCLR